VAVPNAEKEQAEMRERTPEAFNKMLSEGVVVARCSSAARHEGAGDV